MPSETMRSFLPALGLAAALPACVAGPAAVPSVEWRVAVKLAATAADADLGARAAQMSGVQVRYVSAAGGRWHSLALRCTDDAQCADALRRLQADPGIESAERVERHRRHGARPEPAGSASSSPT
jgi:hypothetical protein